MDEPSRPADAKKFRVTRESVARHSAAWDASAMKKYGRVGRDPERIKSFLKRFSETWEGHADLRFGQLVGDVCGNLDPYAPEEERFLTLLAAWTIEHFAIEGDASRIAPFIAQIQEYWFANSDLRFGQLVTNVARKDGDLAEISDDEFLARIRTRLEGTPSSD